MIGWLSIAVLFFYLQANFREILHVLTQDFTTSDFTHPSQPDPTTAVCFFLRIFLQRCIDPSKSGKPRQNCIATLRIPRLPVGNLFYLVVKSTGIYPTSPRIQIYIQTIVICPVHRWFKWKSPESLDGFWVPRSECVFEGFGELRHIHHIPLLVSTSLYVFSISEHLLQLKSRSRTPQVTNKVTLATV